MLPTINSKLYILQYFSELDFEKYFCK